MRYLLDENLSEDAARAMDQLVTGRGAFLHLLAVAAKGTDDIDIPGICRQHDFQVVLTANVKDFGARKVIFEALLKSNIHVLVVRPGKKPLTSFLQVSLISRHFLSYDKMFRTSAAPVLATLTESRVRQVTLTELLNGMSDPRIP